MVIALLIAAGVIPYLIIIPPHFPYLGMAISLALSSTLIFVLKKNKTGFNLILYVFTLLFSSFVFLRANGFLTFLNISAVFLLISLMALYYKSDVYFGFFNLILSPLKLFIGSLTAENKYKLSFKTKVNNELLKSLVLSFIILIIIIPLLASANPFFNKLISNFVAIFNLPKIDAVIFLRMIFFLILAFLIPHAISFINTSQEKYFNLANIFHSFQLLLPKILVSVVIFIFFITQAQLYFATSDTLQTLGFTHSQYAREVFAQLSVVALIILSLIYNDKSRKKASKALTYILIAEGLFLTFIAFKSVYDYSFLYGFTYKRLWGFTGVFWTLILFSFYTFIYIKNLKDSQFIKGAVIISALTLLFVNLLNFDNLIYNYRKSTTGNGIDYWYLSKLSTDANSYNSLLNQLVKEHNGTTDNQRLYYIYNTGYKVILKIARLQKKYKIINLRSLNWSEYEEYLTIKDIDTKYYYDLLSPKPSPLPPVISNEQPQGPILYSVD